MSDSLVADGMLREKSQSSYPSSTSPSFSTQTHIINKDSSAMKTIAILGMFFLPGTFIAVSNLDAQDTHIQN
jgi:hypothetical protein